MRRYVVLAAAVLVAAAALVVVGRWERGQRADEENAGMRTVVAEVGPIDSPSLRGFRILASFDCLVYRRGRVPYALELCIDDEGRLVEAIDRRSGRAADLEPPRRPDEGEHEVRSPGGRPPPRDDGRPRPPASDPIGRRLTRERLEVQLAGAIQALVLAAVLWFALSNSHIYPLDIPVGREVRWAVLALLAGFALAYAAVVGLPRASTLRLLAPTAALLLLAAASVLWAPDAGLSLGRVATLRGAASPRASASRSPRATTVPDPILAAIAGAAVLVALGGLVELWHDSDSAIVPATRGQGARYQGIGQNPNTMAALFAVALPLTVWAAAAGATRLRRAAAVVRVPPAPRFDRGVRLARGDRRRRWRACSSSRSH